MRDFLVFVSTESLETCKPELFGPDRQFDVCIHYYGGDGASYSKEAEHNWTLVGEKFESAAKIIPKLPLYKQYAFLDSDVIVTTAQLNRLFSIGEMMCFPIYQPALTHDSAAGWKELLQDPYGIVRKVPMVEMMCPFFSADGLAKCLPTFDLNVSGWGLDVYLWPELVGHQTFVIDAVPVTHPDGPSPRRMDKQRNGLTKYQELWIMQMILDPDPPCTRPPDAGCDEYRLTPPS